MKLTYRNFISTIKKMSDEATLKSLSGRDDIVISDITNPPLVMAHWMSFILVSGEALRVILKAHFMTDSAQFFASKNYQTAKENVSLPRALDFFREFCNLTAGQVKVDLDRSNVKVAASLPGVIRGFDEIFYKQQNDSVKDCWSLNCGMVTFACSANIEIFKKIVLKKIEAADKTSQGEVEYL
jgi:hypothetical protein